MTRHRLQHRRGFTLMELLVAMSLVLLLLFLTNELFLNTNQVVTRGIQNNKALATARVIDEQLTQDVEAMLGPAAQPDTGGYLVIVQRQLLDFPMIDPDTQAEVNISHVRSDQLIFVRTGDGIRSMTPQNDNSFGSTLTGDGTYARVFYGHAQRTAPNGNPPTAPYSGLDRLANNWILARQALIFNPIGFNASSDTHSNNAFAATNPFLRSGETDITALAYATDNSGTSLIEDLWTDDDGDDDDEIRAHYNTVPYQTDTPLYVNPSPSASGTSFAADQIAKTHPILAQGCSDIIIDFAADTNGNGRVDTTDPSGNDVTGSIRWYDAVKPKPPASDVPTWQTQTGIPQPLALSESLNGGVNGRLRAFVFRVDDDQSFEDAGGVAGTAGTAHSYWPYMIRIRYRLHDARSQVTSNNPAALDDRVDNDGDRVFDEINGDNDEDKTSGIWFERIIRVPRP